MMHRFATAALRRTLLANAVLAVLSSASLARADTHIVSNADDAGPGSLRQAVIDANADAQPPVVVDATGLVDTTITLTTGQISILQPMHVVGPGPDRLTVSAQDNSRVFYIDLPGPQDVTVSGLHVTDGAGLGAGGAIASVCANFSLRDSVVDHSTVSHGALPAGGGVFAEGCGAATPTQLVFSNVTIADNSGPFGGGLSIIESSGDTTLIENSVIARNTATGTGGFTAYGGGAALSGGAVTIAGSRFVDNQATTGRGGGIAQYDGTLLVSHCTIGGNVAALSGGGLFVLSTTRATSASVVDTLIGGNSTQNGDGGGVHLLAHNGYALHLDLRNSTLSGNAAAGNGGGLALSTVSGTLSAAATGATFGGNTAHHGGGVYTDGSGSILLESSTLANNSAAVGGGILAPGAAASTALHNTVVANDTATSADPDTSGHLAANFSLVGDPGTSSLSGTGNLVSGDPLLGPLAYNGGATPTFLPRSDSPLLDTGDPATVPPATDQRGLARVVGAYIDIGAVERQTLEDAIFADAFDGFD